MMKKFDFEGGIAVEIVNVNEKVVVNVLERDGSRIDISGFPNEKDAFDFVMFGDFENPIDNDFINITKPDYELKWDFS